MMDEMTKILHLITVWSKERQGEITDRLDEWFKDESGARKSKQIFPYLVEASEMIHGCESQLSQNRDDSDLAVFEVVDFQKGDNIRLPFNQASGPLSPALGQLIKRTYVSGAGR